jgi:hypothetical protein
MTKNEMIEEIEKAVADAYGYDPVKELNHVISDMGKEDLRKLLFIAANAVGAREIPNPDDEIESVLRVCSGAHTIVTNYKSAKMDIEATVPVGYA